MLKKLEQAVMDVIKDIDHKKKVTTIVCTELQAMSILSYWIGKMYVEI